MKCQAQCVFALGLSSQSPIIGFAVHPVKDVGDDETIKCSKEEAHRYAIYQVDDYKHEHWIMDFKYEYDANEFKALLEDICKQYKITDEV